MCNHTTALLESVTVTNERTIKITEIVNRFEDTGHEHDAVIKELIYKVQFDLLLKISNGFYKNKGSYILFFV